MNVFKFVVSNWTDILVFLVLIASAIVGIRQWIKVKGPIFQKMSSAEKIAYVTRLITNLVPIAMVLVTDAEIDYGNGTGVLKRSRVIEQLYTLIPDEYKPYVTEENLDAVINKVLPEAKKLWEENEQIKAIVQSGVVE
jgi:hypothetical protein